MTIFYEPNAITKGAYLSLRIYVYDKTATYKKP